MSEVNNLEFHIRAKINAEGIDELQQKLNGLSDIANNTGGGLVNQYQSMHGSPSFAQNQADMVAGMSQDQIEKQQAQMRMQAGSIEQIQTQLNEPVDNMRRKLDFYQSMGKNLTTGQLFAGYNDINASYTNAINSNLSWQKFHQEQIGVVGANTEAGQYHSSEMQFRSNAIETLTASKEKALEEYSQLAKGLQQVEGEASKLTKTLSRIFGVMQVMNAVQNIAGYYMKGGVVEAGISAHYQTAFDYTDPLSQYSSSRQAELNERVQRRNYATEEKTTYGGVAQGLGQGMLMGGIALGATPVGWGLGIAGGATMLGGYLYNQYSQNQNTIANTTDTADTDAQLKLYGQVYNAVKPDVDLAMRIGRAQKRGSMRYGSSAYDRHLSKYGILSEQEIGLETEFAGGLGVMDRGVMDDQIAWARANGMSENSLFQFNKASQMTGHVVGTEDLFGATNSAKKFYGSSADPQKIIDLLSKQVELQTQMVQADVNANVENVSYLMNLPSKLFGSGSAYGRPDQLGGRTLGILGSVLQSQDTPTQAYLWGTLHSAGVTGDLSEFAELQKGGLSGNYGQRGLSTILKDLKGKTSGMGSQEQYFLLDSLFKNSPAGFIPQMQNLMNKGYTDVSWEDTKHVKHSERLSWDEFINAKGGDADPEKVKQFRKTTQDLAKDSVDHLSKLNVTLEAIHKRIGLAGEKTITEATIQQAKMLEQLVTGSGDKGGMMDRMTDVLAIGNIEQYKAMVDKGVLTKEEALKIIPDKYKGIFRGMFKSVEKGVRGYVPPSSIQQVETPTETQGQKNRGKLGDLERKAQGGSVSMGEPYFIGEEGMELLVPHGHGTIVNNNQVKEAIGQNNETQAGIMSLLAKINHTLNYGRGGDSAPVINLNLQGSNPREVWEMQNSTVRA